MVSRAPAPLAQVVAAFAAVYLIWGSTYLAIRFAIETLPPFLMAGIRFVVAGAILYVATRARGAPAPTRAHWVGAAIVGALLLLGGNGGVVWAEQVVPSGITAVLIATVPVWMVLLHWWRGGVRPTPPIAVALVVGLSGVGLLVGPAQLAGGGRVDPVGTAVLMFASFCWAAGSLYSRRASVPASPLLATGMQQLAGGALLLIAGSLVGEWGELAVSAVSLRSLLSFGYLVVFGSLVGFSAYIWLLRAVPPALVSTYAYVNPVVAVFVGWALAGEPITPRTLIAAAIILFAVAIITTEQTRVASRGRRARLEALAAEPEGTVGE